MTDRPMTIARWHAVVEGWNKLSPPERRELVRECAQQGHEWQRLPEGVDRMICRRCRRCQEA